MVAEKDDYLQSINVKLKGNNYSYWSYVMRNFLKGKRMWSYVSGVSKKPTDDTDEKYAELLDVWEANNSKILTWINNSVEHSIGIQLAKYETAKQVWDHLARLYTQSNFAKQYQLESDIRALHQKDMSIQEFYFKMSDLWDQLALTEPEPLQNNSHYIARREGQRLVQFLMALRDDFEGLRGNILHRHPHPFVDTMVSELLAKETRLKTQAGKGSSSSSSESVLAIPNKPILKHQSKSYAQVGYDECSFCKQKGHWEAQCPKLMSKASVYQQPSSTQQQLRLQWHLPPSPPHWHPSGQSQQLTYRPRQSNTAAFVPEVLSSSNLNMASFVKQF